MIINKDFILDFTYPVGSIYMSVNSTDPSTLFGGTWERLSDRFLIGASSTYAAGSIGGEATHRLTYDELPSEVVTGYCSDNQKTWSTGFWANNGSVPYATNVIRLSGLGSGNSSHNNMPPYLAVYMWKRTK